MILRRSGLRPDDERDAEECFRRALSIAREQRAKSLELRAAMSLSRLLGTQNKNSEVPRILSDVYDWFTEGFGTPDLEEARTLLEELSRN